MDYLEISNKTRDLEHKYNSLLINRLNKEKEILKDKITHLKSKNTEITDLLLQTQETLKISKEEIKSLMEVKEKILKNNLNLENTKKEENLRYVLGGEENKKIIKELQKEIENLKNEQILNKRIKEDLDLLKIENSKIILADSSLKAKNTVLENEILSLKNEKNKFFNEIISFKDKIIRMERNIEFYQNENKENESKIKNYEKDISELRNNNKFSVSKETIKKLEILENENNELKTLKNIYKEKDNLLNSLKENLKHKEEIISLQREVLNKYKNTDEYNQNGETVSLQREVLNKYKNTDEYKCKENIEESKEVESESLIFSPLNKFKNLESNYLEKKEFKKSILNPKKPNSKKNKDLEKENKNIFTDEILPKNKTINKFKEGENKKKSEIKKNTVTFKEPENTNKKSILNKNSYLKKTPLNSTNNLNTKLPSISSSPFSSRKPKKSVIFHPIKKTSKARLLTQKEEIESDFIVNSKENNTKQSNENVSLSQPIKLENSSFFANLTFTDSSPVIKKHRF
ncbi:hypothetical protein CWI38_1853p0020 [Hamiltosporidium tvaerminnensis]|uniref:Uncharacterized protein n=2 Tax=Hamiltosporidium tvaerminnensis TaxID=1176355 RepID=A0A4Q9LQ33_9MICR|nr:hypothetical protein CWI38_1853p0020 [Hamiltosporidium tvaerminnensis]